MTACANFGITTGETAVTPGEAALTPLFIPPCLIPSATMSPDKRLGTTDGEGGLTTGESAVTTDGAVSAGGEGVSMGEKLGTAGGGVRLGLSVLTAAAGCLLLAGGVTDTATGMTCALMTHSWSLVSGITTQAMTCARWLLCAHSRLLLLLGCDSCDVHESLSTSVSVYE